MQKSQNSQKLTHKVFIKSATAEMLVILLLLQIKFPHEDNQAATHSVTAVPPYVCPFSQASLAKQANRQAYTQKLSTSVRKDVRKTDPVKFSL